MFLPHPKKVSYLNIMLLQHVGGAPCGCCWAFATIGVTECIVGMALGQPISLSEQQLIDCDKGGGPPAAPFADNLELGTQPHLYKCVWLNYLELPLSSCWEVYILALQAVLNRVFSRWMMLWEV